VKTAEAHIESAGQAGNRLDVFIAEVMGLFSRSQVRARVIEARVNGAPSRLSRILKPGDAISVDYADPPPISAIPEDIPLDVIFENDDVIVINKPQGMVVHPGSGNHHGTVVNALLFRCKGLAESFSGEAVRPGIVHRLDKDTSGVMIAAKNPRAHEHLAAQFASRSAAKRYVAILRGCPRPEKGTVETRIARDPSSRKKFICTESGGRIAVTTYAVIRTYSVLKTAGARAAAAYAFVSLKPRTCRTHQLRVHMKFLSAPILGDPIYGKPDPLFKDATLMLHAERLEITLPGEMEKRLFKAPIPIRFRRTIRTLQSFSSR
jgi:23S rRNA pseudouridine1911/1915/1917 synthase